MIDLHMHSTFSDGTLTPEELVNEAVTVGVSAIALTDHDTVGGIPRFLHAAGGIDVRALSGVEVSADSSAGPVHMLGYLIDHTDAPLSRALARIRHGRSARNQAILERLAQLGCALDMKDIGRFAGEDVVGRPHIAAALVANGYVSSREEAFKQYLGQGRSAYVARDRFDVAETIAVIRGAGGVSVLAHPAYLKCGRAKLRDLLLELRDVGLQGIEVHHPGHTPTQRRKFGELARELSLVETGGSDFHGAMTPKIKMGRGHGKLLVPDELLDALEAARTV